VSGLEPDFVVEENLLDLKPFGSLQDPLLAKALEEITGILPETMKAAAFKKVIPGAQENFRPLPEPPNRMVEWMIELPVESNPMK
jgi:hypothetical protein